MWRKVDRRDLSIFERMIGFSVPLEDEVAIISYGGIHIFDLHALRIMCYDGTHPEGGTLYDHAHQVLPYGGKRFSILGLFGGTPIVRNRRDEELLLDTAEDVLRVQDADGRVILADAFEDLSGDWRYATFSPDGDTIVLGMPYDIHIFQYHEA